MSTTFTKIGIAALALVATPFVAVAADIRPPVYKGMPRSVIAYYNWTGFYIGGTIGYGSGSSDWTNTTTSASLASISPKGMIYGVTLGYNWQAGSWVYGLEGDYNFSSIKGTTACAAAVNCETSNTWLATFRGRIGYAFDRLMPYITAGGAYGNIKAEASAPLLGVAISDSATNFGFTVGAGLEYAFLSNWTVKGEYLFVDLGKFSSGTTDVSLQTHIVRAGLNYKF